ncbi:hypothetical protein GCM10010199_15210 [Dactylosporangium roseum]
MPEFGVMRYDTLMAIGSPGLKLRPVTRTVPPVLIEAELTRTAGSGAG